MYKTQTKWTENISNLVTSFTSICLLLSRLSNLKTLAESMIYQQGEMTKYKSGNQSHLLLKIHPLAKDNHK